MADLTQNLGTFWDIFGVRTCPNVPKKSRNLLKCIENVWDMDTWDMMQCPKESAMKSITYVGTFGTPLRGETPLGAMSQPRRSQGANMSDLKYLVLQVASHASQPDELQGLGVLTAVNLDGFYADLDEAEAVARDMADELPNLDTFVVSVTKAIRVHS